MSHTPKLLPLPRTAMVVFLCSLVAVSFTSSVTSAAKQQKKFSQEKRLAGDQKLSLSHWLWNNLFPFCGILVTGDKICPLPPPSSLTLLAKLFFMINIFYGKICANVFSFTSFECFFFTCSRKNEIEVFRCVTLSYNYSLSFKPKTEGVE